MERRDRISDILVDYAIPNNEKKSVEALLSIITSTVNFVERCKPGSRWIDTAIKLTDENIETLEKKNKLPNASDIVAALLTDPVQHGTSTTD